MTDKEKARAYDEALERAKKYNIDDAHAYQGTIVKLIFPELRESKDERIRKWIFDLVNNMSFENLTESERAKNEEWREKVLAYLEKQKVNIEGDFGRGYDCGYEACLHSHGAEWFEKQKETHYTKRNELFDKCVENCDPEVMKEVFDNVDKMLEPKIAFGDWGDKEKKEAIITCLKYMRFIKKITNQEYDDLMNWLDSNLVSKEWSEEDEVYLQDALWCVKQAAKVAKDENDMGACWSAENWLKSLRPSWKPSEEQMNALQVAAMVSKTDFNKLTSLLVDLKKL